MLRVLALVLLFIALTGSASAAVRIDLDADWAFHTDPEEKGARESWFLYPPEGAAQVTVPHSWNLGPTHDFDGIGWYFKKFVVGGEIAGRHAELHFGATFYKSRVWVNGAEIGGHEGGHTAYWFDVGAHLHPGENLIAVAIDNRPGFATIPGYAMLQSPGGSVWYDWWRYGGIVRDVWLSLGEGGLIRRQRIASKIEPKRALVSADIFVENISDQDRDYRVVSVAIDPDGLEAARATQQLHLAAGKSGTVTAVLAIADPKLWNVGAGRLYRLVSELQDADGRALDSRQDDFGLRTVEIRDRHLFVNGRQVRLSGVTRHEDSPGEGLAESAGTIKYDWNDLAALHTTLTRPVHYPQNPAVLAEADRDGILLIPEIPIWQMSEAQLKDPRLVALARQMMREMIEEAGNHPSIFAWSVCNESEASTPGGQAYVEQMKAWINQLDPGRFVSFADAKIGIRPWKDQPVMHKVDFIMANAYFGSWSGAAADVGPWLDFVEHAYPDKMVLISEFGWVGPFSRTPTLADKARIENFRSQLAAFQQRDFIAGTILWTYQDYKSPLNLYPGQVEGYVDHGLVDAYRQRKPSYGAWEERNRPVAAETEWLFGKNGLDGFRATIARRPLAELPSYPLTGYRTHWKILADDGALLAEGEQALADLDRPAVVEAHWPARQPASGLTLTLDILTPAGVRAGGAVTDYAALRFGKAPFPPDPGQLPADGVK